jgi:type II secretory pathway component PulF
MLTVHGLAWLVLLVILACVVPNFTNLFAALHERRQLPALTEFVTISSRHSLWLLPLGFAVDGAILAVLGRLPERHRWLVVAWFGAVLVAIPALVLLIVCGLLLPVLKMGAAV